MDFLDLPSISLSTQAFLRIAYAVLLLGTLILILPQSRRFFTTERHGGYIQSTPFRDRIQSPLGVAIILSVWLLSAAMLLVGYHTVVFALINLAFCRYFFISQRWTGLARGMGAPGFIAHWLGACVFFLEVARYADPSGLLLSIVLLTFQVDFAVIMLSAGIYKLLSGYSQNQGMQLGMVNPQWGHWWREYSKLRSDHRLFQGLNHLAYSVEFLIAILAIIPSTRWLGGVLLVLTFFFITTQIRLWLLCEMVMLVGVIYFVAGSPLDSIGSLLAITAEPSTADPGWSGLPIVHLGLALLMTAYLALLPLAYAGMWYNFLRRQRLAAPLQRLLDIYTNAFGMIIWRVFSVDLVNFFINVYVEDPATGRRVLWSRWGSAARGYFFYRYSHVGESICVTSIFTALKYYTHNRQVFDARLVRYARTIPQPLGGLVRFEYVSVVEVDRRYCHVPVAEYCVDPQRGSVMEYVHDSEAPIRRGHAVSPIFEAGQPGSYAPAGSVVRANSASTEPSSVAPKKEPAHGLD